MPPKTTTTKAELQRQLEVMSHAVHNMKDAQVLKVGAETVIDHMGSMTGRLHMEQLDHIRAATRRRFAHELADMLINTGMVKMTEFMEDCPRRYARVLRIEGSLSVC